jgi:hypothetical protein
MQHQHNDHMSTSGDVIDSADKDGMLFNRIKTGDETWYSLYDPQLK